MKIGLVSCVKQKLSVAAPAQELYVSTLFKKSRRWVKINCDEWYVLSAKYGLVHPTQVIKPYEMTLKSLATDRRRQWAEEIYENLRERSLLRPGVCFVWLAGRDYKAELSKLLHPHLQTDPLEGLRMGERLNWLSTH